jgi:predicted ATPase/class 3 adenylate cyclase
VKEGERKPVTILFADIVGSTAIAEKLDPEEWKEVVSGAHRRVAEAVYRYEGTIAQLLGDGVLAFFGAPITHEDDPGRAVRAALDIQAAIQQYDQELHGYIERLQMRIGIHTGTVVFGPVGDDLHREYLAIGEAVNLAARLQSSARPGRVLISEATARRTKAAFELNPLGEISLKGQVKPVWAFEVTGLKTPPVSGRDLNRFPSPLVGREAELADMKKALAMLQAGSGQIVAVLGEAGIGKSRLVEEACQAMLEAGQGEMRWLTGRALSYGQALSFWSINQLLKADLGLSDGDPETRIKVSLRRRLQELLGERSSDVLPYLSYLMGIKLEGEQAKSIGLLDGETLKRQILYAIREYFLQVAKVQPLALAFEDLHWADPSTLEALESLLALTNRSRLLILLLARPERDHGSWRIKMQAETDYEHRYTEIALKPLSPQEQNQMVDNLLPTSGLPRAIRQMILERSEGNPFYIEELVYNLVEQGVLVQTAGGWQTRGEVSSLILPDTLQGVLLARIDRLQGDVRRTLQLASVIGKSFLYSLLEAVHPQASQLDDHLAQLQRLDLIREKTRQPELEYLFKHSLTQEAAYSSLLFDQRRESHRLVAGALERLFPSRREEFCGLLAHHFYNAGEPQKALEYLVMAGKQAKNRGAYLEASQYLGLTLKLTPQDDVDRRWQALLDLDETWGILGNVEERLAMDTKLLDMARELGDDSHLSEAYYRQASSARMTGQLQKGIQSYQECLAAARRSSNQQIEAMALGSMTVCYAQLGNIQAAEGAAEKALALARELGDEDILVQNLNNVAAYYAHIGDFAQAIQMTSMQLTISGRRGDRFGQAMALLNLGYDYASLGQYGQASETLQRSIDLMEAMGARRMSAYGRLNLGLSCLRGGVCQEAIQILERAASDLQASGEVFGLASQRAYLGLAWEQAGEASRAEGFFAEAKDRYHQSGALGLETDALAGLARCRLALGDLAGAAQHADQVWAYLEQNDPNSLEFPTLSFLTCAEIFLAGGQADRSAAAIEAGYQKLLAQAGRISDLEWRKSTLENVPEHSKIIQLYNQLQAKMSEVRRKNDVSN